MNDDRPLVLVPLNGAPEAEPVLQTLRPLARDGRARVHLLAVAERPDYGACLAEYLEIRRREAAEQGLEATLEVRRGRAHTEILACARERGADLIALTSTGRRGLRRVVEGSVTEAVLRRSEAPVLTCREGCASTAGSRLLVALDGSPAAEAVLPEAVRWARVLERPVDVVQVVLPAIERSGPEGDPSSYLGGVCERLQAQGIQASARVRVGRPVTELLRHIRDAKAGLLFMGSHGRTGLRRAVLGSVAEEMLRTSPCPVIVRRRAGTAAAAAS